MRISDWSSTCALPIWHVLQGSSMEHEIGLRFGEQAVDPLAVAHVADEGAARQLREALRELEVDAVKVEFGIVANGQMSRAERRNLPRQLRADGAAGAGHQHAATLDQALHGRAIERDRKSTRLNSSH